MPQTVCILFSHQNIVDNPDIQVYDSKLAWLDDVIHLRNYLQTKLKEVTEIRMKKSDMIQWINTVLVSLGKSNDSIICKVFNSQCTHYYGLWAWYFEDNSVTEFQTIWNWSWGYWPCHMKHTGAFLPIINGQLMGKETKWTLSNIFNENITISIIFS